MTNEPKYRIKWTVLATDETSTVPDVYPKWRAIEIMNALAATNSEIIRHEIVPVEGEEAA